MGRRTIGRAPLPVLLEKHRRRLAACRACGHAETILPITSIARDPRVMIVGQAPGITESAGGQPFAGQAGRTLFRWLDRIGLDEPTAREHVYIAALTRCYPGRAPSGRGDRVPDAREQGRCAPWLDAELRLIRPALLLPVGKHAIARFLGDRPLVDLVGSVHEVDHAGGRARVLPLPHPSGASSWVYMPGNAALLARALEHLREELITLGVPLQSTGGRSVA